MVNGRLAKLPPVRDERGRRRAIAVTDSICDFGLRKRTRKLDQGVVPVDSEADPIALDLDPDGPATSRQISAVRSSCEVSSRYRRPALASS
jgi:hypothetical protein